MTVRIYLKNYLWVIFISLQAFLYSKKYICITSIIRKIVWKETIYNSDGTIKFKSVWKAKGYRIGCSLKRFGSNFFYFFGAHAYFYCCWSYFHIFKKNDFHSMWPKRKIEANHKASFPEKTKSLCNLRNENFTSRTWLFCHEWLQLLVDRNF